MIYAESKAQIINEAKQCYLLPMSSQITLAAALDNYSYFSEKKWFAEQLPNGLKKVSFVGIVSSNLLTKLIENDRQEFIKNWRKHAAKDFRETQEQYEKRVNKEIQDCFNRNPYIANRLGVIINYTYDYGNKTVITPISIDICTTVASHSAKSGKLVGHLIKYDIKELLNNLYNNEYTFMGRGKMFSPLKLNSYNFKNEE